MKKYILVIFILLFAFSVSTAGWRTEPKSNKKEVKQWVNYNNQPRAQVMFNDTAYAATDTTAWFLTTKYGNNIHRIIFVFDTLANDTSASVAKDSLGFYFTTETAFDTTIHTPIWNSDASHEVVASGSARQDTLPCAIVWKAPIWTGIYTRVIFTVADTCSLQVILSDQK